MDINIGLCVFVFFIIKEKAADGTQETAILANPTNDEIGLNITKRSMTSDEAKAYCSNAILNHTAYLTCREHLKTTNVERAIVDCTTDLKSSGDVNWALSYVRTLTEVCLIIIKSNPSVWISNGSSPDIPKQFITNLCTMDCGDHGSCHKRYCKCDLGYGGELCNLSPETKPVVASRIHTCNAQSAECSSVALSGKNFISNKNLLCLINYITIPGDFNSKSQGNVSNFISQHEINEENNETEIALSAVFLSNSKVLCPLTKQKSAKIRVANNNNYSSTEHVLYVVFNGTCRDCEVFEKKLTCTTKENYCFLDDDCFENGGPADNKCLYCNTSINHNQWSRWESPDCQPPHIHGANMFPNEMIYCLSGILVLVVVLAALVIVVKRRKRSQSAEFGSAKYVPSGGVILRNIQHLTEEGNRQEILN
ncbi:von Willebrand factor D and EGF domain-containing protein-like [Physella acuta]|uniref:von Willebrand factor D and EGF domain-containing protein-like n=1 Tax=Physella acuta TaxID=109671 RepID=UPI0027DACB3B|nr:von Willebrand factor D and EGF domain-containing protein-like [Physella acuta]